MSTLSINSGFNTEPIVWFRLLMMVEQSWIGGSQASRKMEPSLLTGREGWSSCRANAGSAWNFLKSLKITCFQTALLSLHNVVHIPITEKTPKYGLKCWKTSKSETVFWAPNRSQRHDSVGNTLSLAASYQLHQTKQPSFVRPFVRQSIRRTDGPHGTRPTDWLTIYTLRKMTWQQMLDFLEFYAKKIHCKNVHFSFFKNKSISKGFPNFQN